MNKLEQMQRLFHGFGFKVMRLLCTVTRADEIDSIAAWLKKQHPSQALEEDTIAWFKETIARWCDNLRGHFPNGFAERFPLISKKFEEDEGNMLVFLRAADFCGADPEFFAGQIEPIIKAHEVDGEEYVEYDTPGCRNFHHWVDEPHNARCFVLATVSRYTQMQSMYFSKTFFPDLISSGENSDGKVFFNWRPRKG